MNLNKLSPVELIHAYSEIIRLLKESKVIRTKNVIGDLAEHLVVEHYNSTSGLPTLQSSLAGTKSFDATSRKGERYSIKGTSGSSTGVVYGLNPPDSDVPEKQIFDYLIIARFDDNYRLTQILELNWETFLKHKKWHKTMNAWFVSISKPVLKESIIRFDANNPVNEFFGQAQPHKSH